jgi:phenylalanyl-tRNA synthetase beta chain
MIFNYREIEKHFVAPLPGVTAVSEALISHAFEVEEVTALDDGDFTMDVKILPDRALDAKSPLGLAREVSAVLELPLKAEYKITTTEDKARAVLTFTALDISNLVGVPFSTADISGYLERVGVLVESAEAKMTAYIPSERLDLNIKEDLADEVARLYGYDRVPARALLPLAMSPVNHADFVLANQLRAFLVGRGFTEVYGYTFTSQGVVEIEKPLASDKAFLRTNLTDWMTTTLTTNVKRSLFPQDTVNLFEIGSVFPSASTEEKRLCLASNYDLAPVVAELSTAFQVKVGEVVKVEGVYVIELPISLFQAQIEMADLSPYINLEVKYKPVSVYPRIVRDIALLVPAGTEPETVAGGIKAAAGPLLAEGPYLFDQFTKPGAEQTSLAFRLAFQSAERTLSDVEVNLVMENVYQVVKEKGWSVR